MRARVTGIVLKRLFEEGADVKEGQPLFLIDPAPYQAAVDGAAAARARAEASAVNARLVAARNADLVKDNAVSRQEADASAAALQVAEADVAAGPRRRADRPAQPRLHDRDRAGDRPHRPRRGDRGGLRAGGPATLLATVQQLDPIYVDLTQSADEVLRLRRDLESGRLQGAGQGKASVRLVTGDGREYGQAGHAPVRRRHGRPGHRLAGAAGPLPEPQGRAPAGPLRAGPAGAGRGAGRRCWCRRSA